MNSREPIRKLNGKPAVLGGVSVAMGEKVVIIVEKRLRLLTRREWERLPLWIASEPEPLPASSKRQWRGGRWFPAARQWRRRDNKRTHRM
jgi:hypothetical protein